MKVRNGEIFAAKEPLAKLAEKEFPVKVSYGLAKLANKLNEQYVVIEQVRNGLVQKYGEPVNGSANQLSVPQDSEGFPKFVSEFNELLEQTAELVFETVLLPEMVDGVALQIEPSILMALEQFVTVE